MSDDCVRARGWLPKWADGELTAASADWLSSHWEECAACRGERDRLQALDDRLQCFGEKIMPPAEAPLARVRFLAHINAAQPRWRKPAVWAPAMALLAAAALLVLWLPRPAPRGAATDETGFVAVPYVPPIASYERSSVVSMQIPAANLLAEGYSVAADPSSVLQADVLLGEDGRVHAVRLPANQMLKGIGD